jgi:hypothetical protein
MIKTLLTVLLVSYLSLTTVSSWAELPSTIGYQGNLEDAAGAPVNGAVDMNFRLFTGNAGGAPLWEEAQPGVAVEDGYFSVSLGSVTPFDLSFKGQYFLEIQVGSDAPMSPRVKLDGTPYTQRAAAAPRVVVVDAANIVVGDLISLVTNRFVSLLSDTGFIFGLDRITGAMQKSRFPIYFPTSDCSGSGFGSITASISGGSFQYAPGIAFTAVGTSIFYVPKTATLVPDPVLYNSFVDFDMTSTPPSCTTLSGSAGFGGFMPVVPNDPSVTGINRISWPAPIGIDIVQTRATPE